MPQGKYYKAPEKPSKSGGIRPLAVLLVLGVLVLVGVGALVLPSLVGGRFPENTFVGNTDIGGMTAASAARAVRQAFQTGDLTVSLPGKELSLPASETRAGIDAGEAVKAAQAAASAGDTDIHVELRPYLTADEDAVRAAVAAAAAELSSAAAEPEAHLDGELPDLSESADPDAALPTLSVFTGAGGYTLDTDALTDRILDALAAEETHIDASDLAQAVPVQVPDASEIHARFSAEPADAVMDRETGEVTPAVYGYGFDEEELREKLASAGSGETITVELTRVAPAVSGQEACFQDVLGCCFTPHSANENRNVNLALACAALNGVVIQPGETLSYNETVGERTAEAGFLPAPAYSGTVLVDSVGGGVCQVSSTLYLASLFAELETVERVNHGYPVSYIPFGLDATVSWGYTDLKLTNSSAYPVKLVAEVSDGFVRIWIMGTETRDYTVKMHFGSGGRYATAYANYYDNDTGELISSGEKIYSAYLEDITSAVGEVGCYDSYINLNVREQEHRTPSAGTLEAALNYREPNTGVRS